MRTLTRIIAVTLISWTFTAGAVVVTGPTAHLKAQEAGAQRAVLVTGASSGIGRTTTELLAANGFFVYAGARKAQDLEDLNAFENVQSIRLDVTIHQKTRATEREPAVFV